MYQPTRRTALQLALMGAGLPLISSARAGTEAAPLAIKGYDPVAYFVLGQPVRGVQGLEYEWDEYRYRFSRAEFRELFKADPVRYAPQFANYCTMALTRGELEEANPEYWLISEGKLYLFGKPIGPSVLAQDLAANIAKANENASLISNR